LYAFTSSIIRDEREVVGAANSSHQKSQSNSPFKTIVKESIFVFEEIAMTACPTEEMFN
jgi:hypothetical protein